MSDCDRGNEVPQGKEVTEAENKRDGGRGSKKQKRNDRGRIKKGAKETHSERGTGIMLAKLVRNRYRQ